jgi:hypothetical protein
LLERDLAWTFERGPVVVEGEIEQAERPVEEELPVRCSLPE